MPLSPTSYYNIGTVSVAAGGNTVTGVGTSWSGVVVAGDTLMLGGLMVMISEVVSGTSAKLLLPWPGAAQAGQGYAIALNAADRLAVTAIPTALRGLIEQTRILSGRVETYAVVARQDAPPAAPVTDDMYLLGAAPTGAWAGRADYIAQWSGTGWVYIAPKSGMRAYSRAADMLYQRGAAAWTAVPAAFGSAATEAVDAFVRTGVTQALTGAQKLQARTNISANPEDVLAYLGANVPHLWHLGAAYALDGMRPSLSVDIPRSRAVLDGLPVDDSVLFTRTGATKVVTGADGGLITVAANTLAFDYSTGRRRLLLEGAGTNLFIGSSAPAAAQAITVTAQPYTLSFWGTGAMALSGAASATVTGTGANARTAYTFTPGAGTLTLTPSGSVANVQLEVGGRASSHIATTTAAVTRGADVCQLTPAALATLSVAGPRTVVWRGSCSQSGYAALMSLSGQALIRRSTDGLQVLALVPLALGAGLAVTAMDTAPLGIAIGWDAAGGIASVNGGAASANAQVPSGTLSSGHIGWSTGVSGWIEMDELVIWPAKGSSTAMQAQAHAWS